jgi:hypothetical protein
VLVRLRQEVQEVPRGLRPPARPLADDTIRLEPLDDRYVPDFERLLQDPEVVRNTRVPSSPPPDFASMWVGRYIEGWRTAPGPVRDPLARRRVSGLRRCRRPRSGRTPGRDRIRGRPGGARPRGRGPRAATDHRLGAR